MNVDWLARCRPPFPAARPAVDVIADLDALWAEVDPDPTARMVVAS